MQTYTIFFSSEKKTITGKDSCLETLRFSVQEWNSRIRKVISLSSYMLDFHWSNYTGVQLAIHQDSIYYSWPFWKRISDMLPSLVLQTWLITKIIRIGPVHLPNLTECQFTVHHPLVSGMLLPLTITFIVASFKPFLEICLNTQPSLHAGWKSGSIIFLLFFSSPCFKLFLKNILLLAFLFKVLFYCIWMWLCQK